MIQNSIVVLIIAATIGYLAYGMIKSLTIKTKKSGCGGCSGCDLAKNSKGCKS